MKTIYPKTTTLSSHVFEKYFGEILKEKKIKTIKSGPYISISRDFGCKANIIAKKLAQELNTKSTTEWKWFNKEILSESAKALKLKPEKIRYVFMSQKKSMMDEVVEALSTKYYKSDRKIRNTIIEVVKTIVKSGNVIIVGRGGVSFAKENTKSIHIKITAPIDWRINKIMKSYDLSRKKAKEYVENVDTERKLLIENFMGQPFDPSVFDMILNRKTLTEKEILESIMHLIDSKKII